MVFAFPKSSRLLKRAEFQAVLNSQLKAVTPHLVIKAKKSSHSNQRIGLIVSKRVGSAVVRNRFKRLMRECFRKAAIDTESCDYVVIARHTVVNASFAEVQECFTDGIARIDRKLRRPGRESKPVIG